MTLHQALGTMENALDRATAILSAGGDHQVALREIHRARREVARARTLADPGSGLDGPKSSAHEVRGMLSAIAGWAQLLQLKDCDVATVVRAGEAIERNAKALTTGLQRKVEQDDRRRRRARQSTV